jgi:phosphoribosyl 1,2-cyclic phosphodiesterase
MVRFTVLASGSKGNASILTAGRTRILIDAGLSCRELFRRMSLVGEDPSTLNAILITHEHVDHINGLAVTARKLGIPVFFTEATHRAWIRQLTPRKRMTYADWLADQRRLKAEAELNASLTDSGGASTVSLSDAEAIESEEAQDAELELEEEELAAEASEKTSRIPTRAEAPTWLPAVEYFTAGIPFTLGDATISPFTIPHDAADPVGFVFESEGVRLAIATDLGYIPPNVKAALRNLDLLQIESNHDLEMLRDGPYPWAVKQRVLSRVGHLSNSATGEFLENEYDGGATYVILAHLSESNNLPDLARVTAERALSGHASLLANRLLIASQQEPMESIHF